MKSMKSAKGNATSATKGESHTGPVAKKVLARSGHDGEHDGTHDRMVAAAHKAAAKPAGAAGKQFKYPIKMC